MQLPLILVGGGGHAAVLVDTLRQIGAAVLGLTDYQRPETGLASSVPYLGNDDAILEYSPQQVLLVNGLGSTSDCGPRTELFMRFRRKGYRFASVVHPAATVSEWTRLGEGVQLLAGAVVNTDSRLGDNIIINSRAVIEHDVRIGDHCHVAPGAILCGGCRVGPGAHIGAGATLIQGTAVGAGALVAAGAVVLHDVEERQVVGGVPARELKPVEQEKHVMPGGH